MKTNQRIRMLFGLILLFGLSCNENLEEFIIEDDIFPTKTFFTKTVSLDQIPEITTFLESKTKKGIFSGKGINTPLFDVNNIIEVLDTLENKNYTFNFSLKDTPRTVLYNLVVGVDSLGRISTPIVLKYTSSEETYDQWAENDFNFAQFSGTLAQHRYTDFFDSELFSKGNCPEHDQNGDPA